MQFLLCPFVTQHHPQKHAENMRESACDAEGIVENIDASLRHTARSFGFPCLVASVSKNQKGVTFKNLHSSFGVGERKCAVLHGEDVWILACRTLQDIVAHLVLSSKRGCECSSGSGYRKKVSITQFVVNLQDRRRETCSAKNGGCLREGLESIFFVA